MILAAVVASLWAFRGNGSALVVYCAHDAIFSEQILKDFERETGIRVRVRFDTEATKSLGLVELIVRERNRPRCDVFWNNEQLGTMRLAAEGLLEPYKGKGYARIPEGFKDPNGLWTGFAGRLRVWIVNTQAMEATEEAIASALEETDLSRVTIAKPLYGTTRTHYTVLWDLWGGQQLQEWHADWRRRGVVETGGNAMVKDLVAAGTCYLGLTDTDDYFVAKDGGRPVAMLPARVTPLPLREGLGEGETRGDEPAILIPNTVAIIKGTRHREAAEKLVDYLLSAETQIALAKSQARQIPLGPVDASRLPDEVRELMDLAQPAYPLSGLSEAAEACLQWLRSQYGPG